MDNCTVKTEYGLVKGEYKDGVYVWRGIPFAKAPEGRLRFSAPLPPESWEGVREALEFGPSCPQGSRIANREDIREVSEDCLSLNIWSPSVNTKKKPVFFFIHGGAFVEGAGSDAEYEGTKLVNAGDIVLVTVNYRMGVLGFMDFSFLDESFYPNCGLRDIAMALRWTYENIESFGGDRDNITVGGQSAGACCAGILPMFDDIRGYIKRVIMMSAVPTLIGSKEMAEKNAKRFLEFANINDAELLRELPASKLVELQREFAKSSGLGVTAFGISVDGELVKNYPILAAKEGMMQGIPMLFGTTREEMSFAFKESLSHIIDMSRIRDVGISAESEEIKSRIKNAYKRYGKRGRMILFSDFSFRIPSIWYAEGQSEFADTWMYRFDFETLGLRISGIHAFHSSDVPYLFGNFNVGLARLTLLISPIKLIVRKVHREFRGDLLTFIKTGELPWEKCKGENTPAKCYATRSFIEQAAPDEVKSAFKDSDYRRRSLKGAGIEL